MLSATAEETTLQLSDRFRASLKKISCHLIFKYFTKIKSKAQEGALL